MNKTSSAIEKKSEIGQIAEAGLMLNPYKCHLESDINMIDEYDAWSITFHYLVIMLCIARQVR